MYGKIFSRMFENSLAGSGSHVIAVMSYIIAKTVDSRVTLRPKWLAQVIGDTEERMAKAIEFLSSPDPESSGEENEGRRIVPLEAKYEYFVPQYEFYRNLKTADDMREQTKLRVRKHRANKASNNHQECNSESWTKPDKNQLLFAAEKMGLPASEVEKFWNFYEAKGWMIGKNKMKSPNHALANWKLGWESNRKPVMENQI